MFKLSSFVAGLVIVPAALLGHSVAAQTGAQTQVQAVPTVDPLQRGSAGADYLIGPGDTLQVFVWQSPDLSTSVPVRPDGRISTPLVEDMVAVGKTPAKLAKDLEVALSVFVRSPNVSVIVTEPVGTLSQVQVIGQVTTPSGVPFRAGLRILDVLLQVGGITEFAAPNRAILIRSENGKERKMKVRIGDLLDEGDLTQNLALMPGDVIVIPQTWF